MLVLPRIGMPAARSRRRRASRRTAGPSPRGSATPAVVGRPAGDDDVLDRDRHAGERRAARSPAARRWSTSRGRGAGALGVDVQERVDGAVDRGDPVEVRLRHLDRADLRGTARGDDAALLGVSRPLCSVSGRVREVGGHRQSSSRMRGTAEPAAARPRARRRGLGLGGEAGAQLVRARARWSAAAGARSAGCRRRRPRRPAATARG